LDASGLEVSDYRGSADLAPLVDFAAAAVRDRFPLSAAWHPGNIAWDLRGVLDQRQPIGLWRDGGKIAAVGWFVGPAELKVEALPAHEIAVSQVVDWGESRTTGDALSIRVLESDVRRTATLEARGYRAGEPEGVAFRTDLERDVADTSMPEGAKAADCVEIDLEEYAACHRDAWSALDHIGMPNARSAFDADVYRSIRSGPVYDPRLDLVVRTSAGKLASNCICWADDVCRVGLFEPVGTADAFRGRGFGRAVVLCGV
jgi:hypothetical protein